MRASWTGRSGSGAGSRLFLTYALVSLLPVLALGVVLARDEQRTGQAWAHTQGRDKAAVIEQTAIAPALAGDDLSDGLTQSELANIQKATDLAVFSGSITRLRLRSFSGGTVFADDGSKTSRLAVTDPAFQTAVAGKSSVQVVPDPSGAAGDVIRVLEPVVPNSTGQATGVLELYLPYAQIRAATRQHLHDTYLRLGIGLGILYLFLAAISWSTTRRLRAHAAFRHHQALHDPLTGLANRELFRISAEDAVRHDAHGALVLVDLDHFKAVNDTLGHHAGDELLKVVAQRLSEALRTDDLVARLGGDEFGILLPGIAEEQDAVDLLRGIATALNADIVIEGKDLRVEASFGIALFPAHGRSVETLLQRADSAMYQGKRGADGIVVYDGSGAENRSDHGVLIQAELGRAISQSELVLHYQPKVDLNTGERVGVEALVRWQHPTRGLLPPLAFVPAAEQSGLIEPLTDWVLRRALRDREDWLAVGETWPVSVNVSARSIGSASFAQRIRDLLTETDADPAGLCLEITETALTGDTEQATIALAELSRLGVAISIDDFGTGFTSLGQLRTIRVDEIKIDRTFVADLIRSQPDRSIVRAMIGLGEGLGCSITAEGVENSETAAWLRSAGCTVAQGYHFARPGAWPTLCRNSVLRTASLS